MSKPYIDTIFWDLSGTLLRPVNTFIGTYNYQDLSLLLYLWGGKKTTTPLDEHALQILYQSMPQLPEYEEVKLHTQKPVPSLICQWLTAKLSSEQCLKIALNTLKVYGQTTSHNQSDAAPIERMLKAFFDPSTLAHTMQPIEGMMHNLEFTAKIPNTTLCVLSNWDPASFHIVSQLQLTSIFHHFKSNHLFVSGHLGYLKPQHQIYETMFERFNLDPKTCLFIDDQEENIKRAKEFGSHAIRFKDNDAQSVRQELEYYFKNGA